MSTRARDAALAAIHLRRIDVTNQIGDAIIIHAFELLPSTLGCGVPRRKMERQAFGIIDELPTDPTPTCPTGSALHCIAATYGQISVWS